MELNQKTKKKWLYTKALFSGSVYKLYINYIYEKSPEKLRNFQEKGRKKDPHI